LRADQIDRTLGDGNDRRLGMSAGQGRHDRAINDTRAQDTADVVVSAGPMPETMSHCGE
jgi:hypothetical protein